MTTLDDEYVDEDSDVEIVIFFLFHCYFLFFIFYFFFQIYN